MIANLDNVHEIYNIFIQKNRMLADIITLFRRFHLSRTISRMKMEKQQSVSASLLIVLLRVILLLTDNAYEVYDHAEQQFPLFHVRAVVHPVEAVLARIEQSM